MNTDRFKFRVWDKMHNCYHTSDNWFVDLYGQLWFKGAIFETGSDEDFTIEQCTGLRDRNGKLIFEGDVVRVEDECGICDPTMNCNTGIGVITWVCEMWYIDRNVNLGLYDAKQVNYLEIIGNIHEDQFRDLTKLVDEK